MGYCSPFFIWEKEPNMVEEKLFTSYLGKDGEYDLLKVEYLQFSADDKDHRTPMFRGLILKIRPENLPVVYRESNTPQKTISFFEEQPKMISGMVESYGKLSAQVFPNDRLKTMLLQAANKNCTLNLCEVRSVVTPEGLTHDEVFEINIGRIELMTVPS